MRHGKNRMQTVGQYRDGLQRMMQSGRMRLRVNSKRQTTHNDRIR